MRTLRLKCLLIVPICLVAGCTSTSRVSSKIRTVASVGDRPLPIVSGEPGDSVTADRGLPEPRVNLDGRVSGRVYDADGQPVPNARVRLALSGAPGGKVVGATTDRSGAFTLRGLRPGSSYTVIAEWENGRQVYTGRSDAKAPESDVRISLRPRDAEPESPARGGRAARVSPVSERDETDLDDATGESRTTPTVNEEDLPPAPEAETLSRRSSRRRPSGEGEAGEEPEIARPARWERTRRERADGEPDETESAAAAASVAPAASAPIEDESANPLPPALERDEVFLAPKAPSDPIDDDPFAESPHGRGQGGGSLASSGGSGRGRRAQRTDRDEPPPGELVVAPETYTPINLAEAEPRPAFRPPAPVARTTPPPAVDDDSEPADEASDLPEPKDEPARQRPARRSPRAAKPPARKRPTWRDISLSGAAPPLEKAPAAVAAGPTARPRSQKIAQTSADAQTPAAIDDTPANRPQSVAASNPPGPVEPSCQFDPRTRRLVDFRLPDVDGRPVRLKDLDADLVLIDFWGSWCKPCVKAVPQLVDLQKRSGARVQVVGVACESGSAEQRQAKAAQAIRSLGINYPVVVSTTEGGCPLQEALHVQAYPTMVLVDRRGNILWRDSGANPATLARLDRVIASAAKSDRVRKF